MAGCKYDGRDYSEGSEVCQEGSIMRCSGGEWVHTGRTCKPLGSKELQRILSKIISSRPPGSPEDNASNEVYKRVFDWFTLVDRLDTIEFMGANSEADFCTGRNIRRIRVYKNNIISMSDEPEFCASSIMFGRIEYTGFGN